MNGLERFENGSRTVRERFKNGFGLERVLNGF